MPDLDKKQLASLLNEMRKVVSDVEYAPTEHWSKNTSVEFSDSCGCYSECTQEPCILEVWLKGTIKGNGFEQARAMEKLLDKWTKTNLQWAGCECCGEDYLGIDVHLFRNKKS